MSKGLEAFLKRIRQDPSNETYVERFMVLLEEEEASTRLPYYRKLFDFLINFKPLLALEVSYQELKLARSLQSVRDQMKALGRIERCFLALERPGKAEVVRNEIDALRGSIIAFPGKKNKQKAKQEKPAEIPRKQATKIAEPPPVPKAETPQEHAVPELEKPVFRIPQAMPQPPEQKLELDMGEAEENVPEVQVFAFQDYGQAADDKQETADDGRLSNSFDWSLFFVRISEDVGRWNGSRSGKADQWIERLRWNWVLEKRKQAGKLLAQALQTSERKHETQFLRFLLIHTSEAEQESLLKQLAIRCASRRMWLAVIKELLEHDGARPAQVLLYRLSEQSLSADMGTVIVEYANQARKELGLYKLAWQPKDGMDKLKELLRRRPEPGLRKIFIAN